MKRFLFLLIALTVLVALAQETGGTGGAATQETGGAETVSAETGGAETGGEAERIISIDSSGGNQSGNLRFGPIAYTHPDPEGIEAVVSNLTIYAQQAELSGPEGEEISLTDAQGQRTAVFNNGVRVTRNRLTALGPDLTYSEADGLGVLVGGVDINVAPKTEDDDPVLITATEAEFDVDTDISTSTGDVQLTNGTQSAESEEIIFEEERSLAKLTSEGQQVVMRRVQDDGTELVITADVGRALTDDDMLLATGNVTIVDGDSVSTGDTVFYDDTSSRALIIGNPAVSENSADGTVTRGSTLEQRTDIDAVRVYSGALDFSESDFLLIEEQ